MLEVSFIEMESPISILLLENVNSVIVYFPKTEGLLCLQAGKCDKRQIVGEELRLMSNSTF